MNFLIKVKKALHFRPIFNYIFFKKCDLWPETAMKAVQFMCRGYLNMHYYYTLIWHVGYQNMPALFRLNQVLVIVGKMGVQGQ
jgi:hypothetical protein